MIRLWSINRWLRWSGFRLVVVVDDDGPTHLGFGWFGLYGSDGWKRIEPKL